MRMAIIIIGYILAIAINPNIITIDIPSASKILIIIGLTIAFITDILELKHRI